MAVYLLWHAHDLDLEVDVKLLGVNSSSKRLRMQGYESVASQASVSMHKAFRSPAMNWIKTIGPSALRPYDGKAGVRNILMLQSTTPLPRTSLDDP
jgi:hypothetical protein